MSVLGRGSKSFIPELIVDNERKDKIKMCFKDTRINFEKHKILKYQL